MIEDAWNEYRGWARRARALQTSARRGSRLSFVCASVSAILGVAASHAAGIPMLGRVLAFAAAVVAALTPVIGREILSTNSEARWIQARATAEAIKSECFRFAASLGDYSGSGAKTAFAMRRDALTEAAERAGLVPLADPVAKDGDPRCPSMPLTASWYVANRLDEQLRYYAKGQTENERAATHLRTISFASAVIAAILGVMASNFALEWFAPWIGVMTTITTAVMAYGLLERRQFLAATYGAMAMRLSRIKAMFSDGLIDLDALITTTETLLQSEHAAWSEQMTKQVIARAHSGSGETGSKR
jgi:hypothetical protein